MKPLFTPSDTVVERFGEWLERPSPPYSLALGSTCGCDLSQLARETCETLNRIRDLGGYHFAWFDHDDMRHLAGQPAVRYFLTERGSFGDGPFAELNDHDLVLRSAASIGGLVLCGEPAIEATRGVESVCRMRVCHHDATPDSDCCGAVRYRLGDQVISAIVLKFLDWMARRSGGHWEARPPVIGRRKSGGSTPRRTVNADQVGA